MFRNIAAGFSGLQTWSCEDIRSPRVAPTKCKFQKVSSYLIFDAKISLTLTTFKKWEYFQPSKMGEVETFEYYIPSKYMPLVLCFCASCLHTLDQPTALFKTRCITFLDTDTFNHQQGVKTCAINPIKKWPFLLCKFELCEFFRAVQPHDLGVQNVFKLHFPLGVPWRNSLVKQLLGINI